MTCSFLRQRLCIPQRMGNADTKLNFRKAVIQLTTKTQPVDAGDDTFWDQESNEFVHRALIQGSPKECLPGLVNFVPAVAYHFCLSLLAAFTQPGTNLLADPCISSDRGLGLGWVDLGCSTCLLEQKVVKSRPLAEEAVQPRSTSRCSYSLV